MTTILVIVACAVAVISLAVLWEMKRHVNQLAKPEDDENREVLMAWLKEMRESQQQNTAIIQNQMQKTSADINDRLNKAAVELGKMQEMGQSMKELQSVLKSPKLRGNLGEEVMKDLLEQMLPKAGFRLQHKFRSGDTVDAVVKTRNGLIPIDAKFPVENYLAAQKAADEDKPATLKAFQKDIKGHLDKIAKKYILPGDGTVDFAIMYVPGEAVYYEIMTTTELADYGANKKVYLVSPNTFHYFLKTVLVALEGERIEERAKQVMVALQSIRGDAAKLGVDIGVLNRHVTNAKNMMDAVNSSYSRLGSKIDDTGQLQEQVGDDTATPTIKANPPLENLFESAPDDTKASKQTKP